jgi:PAS domain S-box-containing protein
MVNQNQVQNRFPIVVLSIAILLAVFFYYVPNASAAGKKNVLILNSYHQGYKWTNEETQGAIDALAPMKDNLTVYIEYMGTKWVSDNRYFEELHHTMKHKFRNVRFDVIILSDNDALNFMIRYRDDIFGKVPTVFCGINYFTDSDLHGQPLYTGINETANLRGTLEIALRLHPSTKKVVVINDTTITGRRLHDELMNIIPSFRQKVGFEFLEDIEMGNLLEEVKNLPPDSLILYTLFFRDKIGKFYEYDESISMIAQSANVPIYGTWDFSLGYGIVGGLLTSGYDQGSAAGKMALRIMQGEKIENIPVVRQSPTRYMFDFLETERFGIKRSALPPESIVINEPASFYEVHKGFVWGLIVSIAGLTLVVIVLLFNIRRRKEAEKAIIKARDELESRVKERTSELYEVNRLLLGEIAERKQAEEALMESERRLRDILQGSPKPAFVIGKDHKVIYWNRALEELSRIKAMDVIGTAEQWRAFYKIQRPCLADLLIDQALEVIPQWYSEKYVKSRLLEEAYEATDFFPALREKGKWLHFTAAVIRDYQGDIIGAIETLEDITERKQADEALKESEQNYRDVVDNANSIILRWNKEGRILFMNPYGVRFFGYSEEELIGRNIVGTIVPETEISTKQYLASLMNNIGSNPEKYKYNENENIRKNGGRVWISWTNKAITGDQGNILEILSIGNDITEKKSLESKLFRATKMQAIGTLAGGIAHDFNNILGAIMGYTEMALTDNKADDRLRRYLEQVYKAGKRASDLVKQILTFSRQQKQERKPLLVAPIIKEGIKLLRSSLPSTVQITQSITAEPTIILSDPTQMHQIIMNLCANASHAMREKGGVLDIRLVHEKVDRSVSSHPLDLESGNYAKLTVSDTGHGIHAFILDRIFDPFFTTKEPEEGTGLGLSIVYGIVKEQGGTIDVSSEPGKGATFSVYLPMVEAEDSISEPMAEAINGGTERIIYVDDEVALVELGSTMLTSLGYRVTSRTSSIEALEAFRASPGDFDLVITDMTMPNMRGDELARELLKIRPDLPIILCTGFSEIMSEERAKSLGIRQFVMKPVSKKYIAQAIREALAEK